LVLDEADRGFLKGLVLSAEENVDVVTGRFRQAARADLAAFRSTRDWPTNVIELSLRYKAHGNQSAISLGGLAKAIGVVNRLSLISSPGTGKSTTLLQLAEKVIDGERAAPVIVPLAEWSGSRESIFEFVTRRNAFRSFREQHLQLLAFAGRLVLLIDGWNEADPDSRIHAIRQIKALERDFPLLSIVIATRRQGGVPSAEPVIEIAPLSDAQQLEIARRFPGGSREGVLDRAWRTPGIRELIVTPLYLNALLRSAPEGSFPLTREEVLAAFVAQHEGAEEKAEALKAELFGCHTEMLVGLAVEANQSGKTIISEENARRAISRVGTRLHFEGQLATCPQPFRVLEVLVNAHALVRTPSGGVSFQHQQFQEWYASFEVERLMVQATRSEVDAKRRLRTDILNWLTWEESILFACERLSRKGEAEAKPVGAAVIDALGIDPMLAAEMIFRSSDLVWDQIKDQIVPVVARWHTPRSVDRALRFMITTGRHEFAGHVWPLIASPDRQVYLEALRKPHRFRPSVLGADAAERLSNLPDNTRGSIVAAIAHESGFDGLELATRIAKTDPMPEVAAEIIFTLAFRRADRQVSEILNSASEPVWKLLAAADYDLNLVDPSQSARLAGLRSAQSAEEDDPVRVVVRLANSSPADELRGERIAKTIESKTFPIETEQSAFAFKRAMESYPSQTSRALVNRLQAGFPVPFRSEELLKDVPTIDEGPLTTSVLSSEMPEQIAGAVSALIGPVTIGKVLEQLFLLHDECLAADWRIDEATKKEYHRLKDVLAGTRQAPFVEALLKHADCAKPIRIQLMADLLAGHGKPEQHDRAFAEDLRPALVQAIELWIHTLLTSAEANRHQLADVARAVERVPEPQFTAALERMLQRDLADWARAREDLKKSQRRGPFGPDVMMSWTLQYARAFTAIGGPEVVATMKRYLADLRFGLDAASVLSGIWKRESGPNEERRFWGWNNFANVSANRLLRQDSQNPPPTSDAAEAIFDGVREIGTDKSESAIQQHAIKLATVALGIPHGAKRAEIDSLMGLPLPFSAKRGLLTASAEAGEILRAQDLIDGVNELLELAKKEPWHLDHNSGELMGWIVLFPFSDRPKAVLEMYDSVPNRACEPWDMDRLLTALADSPHEDVVSIFKALAERDPRILQNERWLFSLLKVGTEAAASLIVEFICDGKLPARNGFPERQFGDLVKRFMSVRSKILQVYPTLNPGTSLESILLEVADQEIVLVLVRSYARWKRGFSGNLAHAVRQTAVGRRPVGEWSDSYHESSLELTGLRKELFSMVVSNSSESELALACLIEIEELRDEYGKLTDEPRHPNIELGRPVPLEPANPITHEAGQPSRVTVRIHL
jgi:hypothetical protein